MLRIETIAGEGLAAAQVGDYAAAINHFNNAAALAEYQLAFEEGRTS